ncbi:uncharacterized protein LOC117781936 isoform X2 [Drosophila innubila]|uniref:uncharacterized protein LOC117781936 isoform X2 n=1 Tax=Drosophila innubila TaxID=198719 RepID=UPI00148DCAB8|nr:uncharacterized protein LOC117781936 isoform X2 [Drosophila innubila]
MSADNVPLISTSRGPSAVQFGASKEFQTRTHQQELDSAFLGNERRPWMNARSKVDQRRENESIKLLLGQGYNNSNNVEKLLEENISFRDLGSLTDEDLQMFGFASTKDRKELIKMFGQLANQDPSYDYICQANAAKGYNNQIVGNAANHLTFLRSSLTATNYKLQMMPPEDVIVGDKRYASRFALDALNSVQSISDELAKDLCKLEQLTMDHRHRTQNGNASPTKENLKILYYTAIALGTACAWFWWWSKRSQSPSLDNLSVKI